MRRSEEFGTCFREGMKNEWKGVRMSGKECGCVERSADDWTGVRMTGQECG
jgi:hypothetical protein